MELKTNLDDILKSLNDIYGFKLKEIEDLIHPLPILFAYDMNRKLIEFKNEVEQALYTVSLHKAYEDVDANDNSW